ncbi:two-component system response regulator YesN [Fontibacillus phaseoli]|uniref:Two-component system response regulator YesN n=1 Tax=Fontibacillus phaseoli TaxID=1416533 RepID=A0A369BLV4_9BACL|nr:response regulator [Fontibacillus phaseoli]RCX21576.1 two-component system response regulator YesN [Fontibacillus phaseoli]
MQIRVLLADDEPVILRGLKKLISWEALGFSIVGEANDGNELRQFIHDCRPDLIISDISMPGCSGLDVIRELHEQGRQIKVVFISAYQEFAYARQAIQYGALDYLVKPVSKKHLEDVVSKAASLIRQENEGERVKEMLTHYERKNRTVTIEELLDGLMDGDKRAAGQLIDMGAIALSTYTGVILLETDEEIGGDSRWEERERKLVHFALNNVMKETLDNRDNCLMFHKDGRFGILIQYEQSGEPLKLAQDLYGKINMFLKLKVSVGIGVAVSGIEATDESYRSALEALKTKYFTGLNRIVQAGIEDASSVREIYSISELQGEIVKALSSQNKEQLIQTTGQLLEVIKQTAGSSRYLAITNLYNTILLLEQEMENIGVHIGFFRDGQGSLLERLSSHATFASLVDEFTSIVHQAFDLIAHKLANKEITQLRQIKVYMEEHYAENITLESMAAMIYMNPYYLSSFFKKHTGKNFKQYLTEERMKHALRLLLETDLMIYEIAERVGYNNARHFSDMFKKIYGKLPQEYRQSGVE